MEEVTFCRESNRLSDRGGSCTRSERRSTTFSSFSEAFSCSLPLTSAISHSKKQMRIHFGGVRGSCVAHGNAFQKYGTATTSLLIEEPGSTWQIFLDAGTGLRNLLSTPGLIKENAPSLFLFSHLHLDHIEGLPSFRPLFQSHLNVTLACADVHHFPHAIHQFLAPPFWPITPSKAIRERLLAVEDHLSFGPFDIECRPGLHPGGCSLFRISHSESNTSFLYATDLELPAMSDVEYNAFFHFLTKPTPPTCLYIDGQFCDENYEDHSGWGHSPWQRAAAIAQLARIPIVRIGHHAPDATDATLAAREKAAQSRYRPIRFAREGEVITLGNLSQTTFE